MIVRDLCNLQPITIAPTATVVEAARTMRRFHVGFLVVVPDELAGAAPVGVLTDRDIVVETITRARDPGGTSVSEAMSRQPLTVGALERPERALAQLRAYGVRRAPVVDERGRLVGVVSLDDLLDWLASALSDAAAVARRERNIERQVRA